MINPLSNHKLSLRWYLTLFISLIVIFTTLVLLLIPAKLYKNQYFSQAQNYCKNMVVQTSTGIHAALQQFDDTADKMIVDKAFVELLKPDLDHTTRIYLYQNIIREYFPPSTIPGYYIRGIDFYCKDPAVHLQQGGVSVDLNEPFSSTLYTNALQAPLSLNWNDTVNQDTLVISRIVYDLETYNIQGLLVISISRNFLLDKFNTYNTMEVENLFIVDGSGTILCSDDISLSGTIYPDYEDMFTETIGTIDSPEQITIYCKSSQVTYQYPYQNWHVVININKNILLHDFNNILRVFYLIALLIVLAGIWISAVFSRYISRPIQKLVSNMAQVQEGNLQTRVDKEISILEISLANQGFNTMVQRLNTLINTVYRIEIAQKEAQFKALQAQINPHFLFNTMQLINWKANEYEAYPVCDMVQSLSYMLETTLNYRDERTFTLREELLYLQNYAQIIHYKYMDKIQLHFNIPEELLDCQIPILVFQPFIENAIVHGLEPKQGNGTVSLTIIRRSNDLSATIEDDGAGIRPDILRKLRENVPLEHHTRESSYHMALFNIQTRIKLLYGENYGYEIQSRLYQGTCITLTIPYKTAKGEEEHD
ncbi:MAG: sensor histidine kinase [Eubacteriales bacterium]|nr:sensor histidine kinase [Eubacteriales bacterium]